MATVENVHLAITASATKPGFSDITYSYELHPSEISQLKMQLAGSPYWVFGKEP